MKRWLRLEIDPVIRRSEELAERVQRELPGHAGLIRASAGVAGSAREAKRVSDTLRRTWGLHRLPALFLAITLLVFAIWIYWRFFHVSTLRIAVPEDDAVQLQQQLSEAGRVKFRPVETRGSRQSVQLLADGEVDLAFVQGGVPLPSHLPRLLNPSWEVVLYFVRDGVDHPAGVKRIMTSAAGQGSHSVAQAFVHLWQVDQQVSFTHDSRARSSAMTVTRSRRMSTRCLSSKTWRSIRHCTLLPGWRQLVFGSPLPNWVPTP